MAFRFAAIDHISFEVEKGQIVGFLSSRVRAILVNARRAALGVDLPIFQLRPFQLRRLLSDLRDLRLAQWLELLRDPDVVFDLAYGRAAQREAVNRQTENVR